MRSYLLLTSAILAVALTSAGCKDKKGGPTPSDGSSPDQPKSGGPGSGGPRVSSGAPDFTMTPAEYRAEFARDGKGAGEKFRNKVIELNGVVAIVGQDPFEKKPGIFLKAEGEWTVFCATTDPQPWQKVTPGATVKLRGLCRTPSRTRIRPSLACRSSTPAGQRRSR